MTSITSKIGRYDADTASVPVTFTHKGVTHKRSVNAVLDASGAYDKTATAARVDEVARGVAEKIAAGVLR